MNDPYQTLIAAAVRAPSGDNTQPWRFEIDPAGSRILLYVDETRDPSPMNASQCMSRLAVGAALENMLRAAKAKALGCEPEPRTGTALAVLRVTDFHADHGQPDPAIVQRVTNRRPYDGRPLPADMIARLERESPGRGGDPLLLGLRPPAAGGVGPLDRCGADALMLSEPSMRRAFLANVRFDLPANAEAEEYLPLGSLELPFADRTAFRFLPWLPDWALRLGWTRRKFAAAARRLAHAPLGLCASSPAASCPETTR